jgi:hypothetical protein
MFKEAIAHCDWNSIALVVKDTIGELKLKGAVFVMGVNFELFRMASFQQLSVESSDGFKGSAFRYLRR